MATNINVNTAHRYAIKVSKEQPHLKEHIVELIELMYSEIAAGESSDNEAVLLVASVDDLLCSNVE